MKKYKTAVIGIGFIGKAHIEALRRLGNVEVVAISSAHNVQEKAKSLYVEKAYLDYKKMIDELDLDFVHICTPNNLHFEMAKYALEHEVNVVLEKPLTFNKEEAIKLTNLAKEKGLINAVNFHNRLYPACAYAKKLISKKKLGEIFSINGNYTQDWLLYNTDYSWRLNSAKSGITRTVADIGSHWMDLVEYMTGLKIVEVFAEFKIVHEKRKKPLGEVVAFSVKKNDNYHLIDIDTEDLANILYRFDNGAIGSATFTQMSAGIKNRIDVLVSGEEASLEWRLENHEQIKLGYKDKPNEIITKDFLMMKDVLEQIDYPAGHLEGYADAIKQVFKQVYSNPKEKFYASFEDGLRQMILTEKIYESAKKHSWIKINR